jgi:flagellar biosynthesis anti-sigma factor FlgM
MKIHSENPVSALHGLFDRLDRAERAVRTGRTTGPASACGTGQATGPIGDGLEVSARAREIARLRGAIEGLPEVRQWLVDRLREEIAGGLYHADGRRIADAMLDEERAFAARAGTGRP